MGTRETRNTRFAMSEGFDVDITEFGRKYEIH